MTASERVVALRALLVEGALKPGRIARAHTVNERWWLAALLVEGRLSP